MSRIEKLLPKAAFSSIFCLKNKHITLKANDWVVNVRIPPVVLIKYTLYTVVLKNQTLVIFSRNFNKY